MIRIIPPSHPIKTKIRLSGSKSLSNRLLILKEILDTDLLLKNISTSEDTLLLIKALEQIVDGGSRHIDTGHAGSDLRFLTAFLSVKDGAWTLTGSERMKQRPVGELVNALHLLGAEIKYVETEGFPPLEITGHRLKGGRIEIDGSVSSQFITALLLTAPAFENGLELELKGNIVSRPYIDMTVELLKQCGVTVEVQTNSLRVLPLNEAAQTPSTYHIESDWSSASYWYSICALSTGAQIELSTLQKESLQADSVLPDLYQALGVTTTYRDNSVILTSTPLHVTEFVHDFTNCPDIAQTVALTCCGLGIKAQLTGLQTLKIKETDRIAALKNELEKFGLGVEASDTTLTLSANRLFQDRSFTPAFTIDTYKDHRMGMSFAALALRCRSLSISEPEVVRKSYPTFWDDLKSAGFSVNLQP